MSVDATLDRSEFVERLLPSVETDLFSGQDEVLDFWVGKISEVGDEQIHPNISEAVARLRANVYVKEKKYYGSEILNEDGTESDSDDERSKQFAVLERLDANTARAIACGRMIVKLSDEDKLPIEKYFPEAFEAHNPPENSVEISRFISRHPNKIVQHIASLAVVRAMTYESIKMQAPTTYCMVEKPLLDMLNFVGLPAIELGTPRDIPEQSGVLYPVDINPYDVIKRAIATDKRFEMLSMYFAENEASNDGLGYYDNSFLRNGESL